MWYSIAFGVFCYFVYADAGDGTVHQSRKTVHNPTISLQFLRFRRKEGFSVKWSLVTLWLERAVASTPQAIIVLASSDEILAHCARPHCFVNLLGKNIGAKETATTRVYILLRENQIIMIITVSVQVKLKPKKSYQSKFQNDKI